MNPIPNPHWHEQDEDENEPRLEVLPPLNNRSINWVRMVRRYLGRHWNPKPVKPPEVDPELPHFTGLERSAEVVRYTTLSTEHWLSPKGCLREWVRFNVKVFCCLLVPSLIVAPLITFTLGQFKSWAALIVATTSSIILFPFSLVLLVGLISGLVYLAKSLMVMRRRSEGRRGPYDQYY